MSKKSGHPIYEPEITDAKLSKDTWVEPGPLSDLSMDAFLLLDENLNLLNINDAGQRLFGVSAEAALGKCIMDVMPNIKKSDIYNKYRHILKTGEPLVIHQKLGDRSLTVQVFKLGDSLGIIVSDITERKLGEKQRELPLQLLEILNRGGDQRQLIRDIVMLIKEFSGFEAVGIRIKAGEDFPYYETQGFGEDFLRSESSLCAYDLNGQLLRDEIGNPLLECMCGNIICGRFDPQEPLFTQGGSFWTNSTTELLGSTTEADRQARTRNRCNGEGYESVALIPLKFQGTIVGLLQLNDKRRDRFTQQLIGYYEGIGQSIGLLLARKKAEEALKDSEKHYAALVENLTDAVFLFKDGVITWCNDRVEDIYGYPKNGLLGKHASFFYPSDVNPDEFTRILSSALKEQRLFNGTTRFQRKNGSIVDIEYSLSQICGEAPLEIIAVARDITESKLVEREHERMLSELVEKTKELEQIIYVTSHDLRSPLVNIQGFTRELGQACTQLYEALNNKDVPSALRERLAPTLNEDVPSALQHILASSSKMNSLLSGLLRLSRLGRAALKIKRLGMNKLMAEVVASFEFQVKESGVKIRVEELPPCYGHETQINQVFSNLLDNSLKFLDPNRPGVITISGKEDKGLAIYCVEDNGIGIADKDRERIFEIFCRLDPDDGIGEGLGLTIVRKILDRHSGKVWVESEPGKGSRFFVSLQTKGGINDKK
jgi:PAS domain S-box-containing protein